MHGSSRTGPVSVFLAIAISLVLMQSGCSNGGDSGGGPSISIVSITVTPSIPDIPSGISIQFTATGYYSDGSSRDITTTAIWTSSDTTVATVTATRGLVAGVAPGITTIRALSGAVSGTANLVVTSATLVSIAVTPSAPTIANGTTQQFTAIGTFTSGPTQDLTTQVTWASSTTAASISNTAGSKGRATGLSAGSTNITAALGVTSPAVPLTVTSETLDSIAVTPSSPAPSIANSTTQQFTAIGTFSDLSTQDLTTQVTWYSSNFLVALISNTTGSKGLATARSTGTSNITARFGLVTPVISPAVTLTVTNATLQSIAVTPPTPGAVAPGATLQFIATGTYSDATTQDLTSQVTWNSATTSVASISNTTGSKGLATGLDAGTTDITATLGTITSSPAVAFSVTAPTLEFITISPLNPIVAMGTTQQFTCMATYSNNSSQDVTTSATWSSVPPGIADFISTPGLATLVAVGVTTITADYFANSHSTGITVTPAALVSISVSPPSPSVLVGATRQFAATGNYSDGSSSDITASVTWTSSNQTVATVNSTGLATAVGAGFTQIRATFGAITGYTTMTVPVSLTSITVTPSTKSIARGTKWQFTAAGNYSDGSSLDITALATWGSSLLTVATVSDAAGSKGLASAVDVGSATITADYGGRQGTAVLTVANVTLTLITVTPAGQSIPVGSTRQFTATGSFSGGAPDQDITQSVTWASTISGIASISNTSGSQGLATAVSVGAVTISATGISPLANISGSTVLSVTLPSNAYVTNYDSDSVTVINTVTDTVTGTIAVGDRPSGIAVDLAASRAYVANSGDNTVSVINTLTNTVVPPAITVGITPEGVAVHPTVNKVYVANKGGNSVSVISTVTGIVLTTVNVGTNPYRIAIDAAANRAYVTNEGSHNISVINTATDTLLTTLGSGGFTPRGIAVSPALSRIYVANSASNYVAVMSVAGVPVAYPAVGTGPVSMAIDLSTTPAKVYAGNTGSATISVIRTDNNAIDGTIAVGSYPYGIGIQAATGKAYVANFGSNSVSVINTTTKEIITTITVLPADLVNLKGPYGVAVP